MDDSTGQPRPSRPEPRARASVTRITRWVGRMSRRLDLPPLRRALTFRHSRWPTTLAAAVLLGASHRGSQGSLRERRRVRNRDRPVVVRSVPSRLVVVRTGLALAVPRGGGHRQRDPQRTVVVLLPRGSTRGRCPRWLVPRGPEQTVLS